MATEKRLIDGNLLIRDINDDPYRTESEKSYDRCLVHRQPTVDAVEVVRWIPVTERLPDTFGTFIVVVRIPTRKRTYSDSADFDPFAKKWTTSLFWGKGMNVTHWMPLPEPPKEEHK